MSAVSDNPSAGSDNPYFVNSQFQSDGWGDYSKWRNYFSQGSTSKVDPEPADSSDLIQQLHKDVRNRRMYLKKYGELCNTHKFWSSDFKKATPCLYECLYVYREKLYQGHSILHDIFRDETRKPLTHTDKVLCEMYECSVATHGEKLWVLKKGNNVLWRIKSYH